jgi:exo-beta-1,3-glucanase (GH17 family)
MTADLPDLLSQQPVPMWRRALVLGGLALGLLILLLWSFNQGRPVALPEAAELRLPCVSYAPFRRPGHSPFDPALRVDPAMIEADLRLLSQVTGCVRTYGLDHGLDAVPAIARKLGLRVVLGAWIDGNAVTNQAQLDQALELSRDYADVIDLLVVGNEVLLRGELPPAELANLLARARRESAVPVAYADVWEFWLRHADVLRPHVDVVAAHVLPYWEDEPVAIEQAVLHVAAVNAKIRAFFAPLPVFIAETGWPAAGRQRGAAVPGRLEQARFIRELLARQDATLHYNLIEGFDQPWKRQLEGAMGGYWGLFAADGTQRVSLNGPVVADPVWWRIAAGRADWGCCRAVVGNGRRDVARAKIRQHPKTSWQGGNCRADTGRCQPRSAGDFARADVAAMEPKSARLDVWRRCCAQRRAVCLARRRAARQGVRWLGSTRKPPRPDGCSEQ